MAALNKSICRLQVENTRLKTELSKTNAKIKEADQKEQYLDLEICTLKSKHNSLISKLSSLKVISFAKFRLVKPFRLITPISN